MPKREKTPPPPDDEPRYLTVVHPYPLNANLMLHADRRTLALWLACCTGKDVLLAMYHKPTSPGMVIIEVDRDFDQFEMLLGKHDWSKFLSNPNKEEGDKSSKVFWCHYNSGRLVQKHGWKRVDIEEHWFTGWSPANNVMKFPYPKSTYCDVPSEAQTGVPLCRPLPKAQFPVPPPAPKPPVGSAEWNHAKSSDTASVTTSSSRKGRGKSSGPSDSVSMISSASVISSYSRAAQPRQPPAAPPVPAWQVAGYRAKSAWARGPPSTAPTSITSPPASRAPSTIGSGRGSRAHSVRAPGKPPGLTMEYQHFNWADDLDRYEEEHDDEPPTPPASSSSINLGSGRRPPDPEGPIDPDQDYEYQDDDRPKRSISVAMKDVFDGTENADDLPPATWEIDNGIELKDDPEPWIGYDAPKWEAPTKINRKGPEREEWQCPDHGPMCNPGICKERARVERERRQLKEHEDRMEKKRVRIEKQEKRKLREAEKLARAEEGASSDGDTNSNSNSTGSETDRDGSRNEDKHPPANPHPDDWSGNKPLSDDDDEEAPKVNLRPGHRTPSVSTSYDEGRQRLSPSFPDDDGRSFKSAWTRSTSASAKKDNVSRGNAGGRQPSDARSVAASVRSAASSSAWSDAPISSRSSVSGQRNSDWDTRSAASSHLTAPSMSNGQAASGNEAASISSSQRQRSGMPRSPSVHTTTSSVVSGRPTETYAASISQSSHASAKQPSERDSRSSATLANTSSSTRSKRPTETDQTSNIAEWCQKTSVACSSTGPRTAVSSRSPTPTDGRSVARSSTSARSAVTSRSSAPTDGGFPTFEDTEWGDPIAASQDQRRESKRRSKSKKEADAESGDSAVVETEKKASESAQSARSGKKSRGWNKNRGGKAKPAAKMVDTPQPQEDSLSVAAGYNPRPSGPGSKWGDTNAEW